MLKHAEKCVCVTHPLPTLASTFMSGRLSLYSLDVKFSSYSNQQQS